MAIALLTSVSAVAQQAIVDPASSPIAQATTQAANSATGLSSREHLPANLRAAIVEPQQATRAELRRLAADGFDLVAFPIVPNLPDNRLMERLVANGKTDDQYQPELSQQREADLRRAVEAARTEGLGVAYWLEVARCPELADRHPEWMASVQGHDQWRRLFPAAPQVEDGEVVKVYPWVPIGYEESFAGHLQRIERLLGRLPAVGQILLNDLQAAPSACGCGNLACRWTTDYGPIKTATPLGDDAAARFVDRLAEQYPAVNWIPVWAPECEEHDGGEEGLCAGVGCYPGACWKAYARQFSPLAANQRDLGALLLDRTFGQLRPPFAEPGQWVRHGVVHGFQQQLSRHGATPLDLRRLLVVVEAWDRPEQVRLALRSATEQSGITRLCEARAPIAQGWQPIVWQTQTHAVVWPSRTAPSEAR